MPTQSPNPVVSVIMGSQSDWDTMKKAVEMLDQFHVPNERRIVSAHRTPKRLFDYARDAAERGVKVIIAGAGGAAHLPGMTAALTHLPVIGVPVASKSNALNDDAAVKSILMMPGGVPVAAMTIGEAGAKNAALYAVSILALHDSDLNLLVMKYRIHQTEGVAEVPT